MFAGCFSHSSRSTLRRRGCVRRRLKRVIELNIGMAHARLKCCQVLLIEDAQSFATCRNRFNRDLQFRGVLQLYLSVYHRLQAHPSPKRCQSLNLLINISVTSKPSLSVPHSRVRGVGESVLQTTFITLISLRGDAGEVMALKRHCVLCSVECADSSKVSVVYLLSLYPPPCHYCDWHSY
jgi:hypothetical protein